MNISHKLTTAEKIDLIRKAHNARPSIPATRIEQSKKVYDRSSKKRETREILASVHY